MLFAEDDYAVADLDLGHVCYVNHADIHAYAAYGWAFDPVDKEADVAASHVAVDAVGIADGDGGYDTAPRQNATASVADGGVGFPFFQGDYDCAECGNLAQRRF